MTNPSFAQARLARSAISRQFLPGWSAVLLVLAAAAIPHPVAAQITTNIGGPPPLAAGPRQRLDQQFKRRLPAASKDLVDRAERAFLDHLHETSGMAAEQLAAGRIDDDDLSARIDVFLGDHPELSGTQGSASRKDVHASVVEALARDPDLARTDAERRALADRFIVWLGGLSGTARDTLLAGRMAPDELQSRIDVFVSDVRTERSKAISDPAVAAVPAIEEAFEKANLGPVTERADSICCRGTESDGAVSRDFVLIKKRPASIRINLVQGGLVAGVLAYDGMTAWRQVPGHLPIQIQGPEAKSLISSARYDDPLVGYRERGATARLESAPGASPIRVSIREPSGEEIVETIDPATFNELSSGRRDSAGILYETRFKEYRKVGPVSVAGLQELWVDGVLRTTTRIGEVRLDTGVLARIFSIPTNPRVDYMDFMGGLQVLAKASEKNSAGVRPPQETLK